MEERIRYYRRLKSVDRMSGTMKHRPYNILEHQFMVAVLFRMFASKEDVAYDMQVFDLVLNHDFLESISGDIVQPTKNASNKTKLAWEIIERELVAIHPKLERYSDENIKGRMTELQRKLFKACDYLDLWIFLKEEAALGNSSKDILDMISNCERLIPKDFKSVNKFMETYTV